MKNENFTGYFAMFGYEKWGSISFYSGPKYYRVKHFPCKTITKKKKIMFSH